MKMSTRNGAGFLTAGKTRSQSLRVRWTWVGEHAVEERLVVALRVGHAAAALAVARRELRGRRNILRAGRRRERTGCTDVAVVGVRCPA